MKHFADLVDNVKEYFKADEEGKGSVEKTDNSSFNVSNEICINSETFYQYYNYDKEGLFLLAPHDSLSVTTLTLNGVDYKYQFMRNSGWSDNRYALNCNNQICIGKGSSNIPFYSKTYSENDYNITYKYGFFIKASEDYIFPYMVLQAIAKSTGVAYYDVLASHEGLSMNYGQFPINASLISPVTSSIDYNVHKPLDTQPLKDYLSQQEQLGEVCFMTEFVALMSATLANVSSFLMSEPMVYFVGLAVLAFIVGILVSVFKSSLKSM